MLSIIISAILTLIFIFYFIKINVVKEFWNGHRTLAESYWVWLFVGPMIIIFILEVLGLSIDLDSISTIIASNITFTNILHNTIIFFYLFYFFFVLLGIWRSADNYIEKKKKSLEYPIWGKLTKFLVFLYGAYIPLLLLGIFNFVKSKIKKE
mgnify:CR=1 FL=1